MVFSRKSNISFLLEPLHESHSHTSDDEESNGHIFLSCLGVDDGEEICSGDIEERSSSKCGRKTREEGRNIRKNEIRYHEAYSCCKGKK